MLDITTQAIKPNLDMETHPYNAGRDEMREQLLAFIYERYCYNRTYFGKDSQVALELKRLILDIREDQAKEMESQNEIEVASE
jgi:hypothetical protein